MGQVGNLNGQGLINFNFKLIYKMENTNILELIKKVENREREIVQTENPVYKTSKTLRREYAANATSIVHLTVLSVEELVECFRHIYNAYTQHWSACTELSVDPDIVKFEYQGYSYSDWKHDFKAIIAKKTIEAKKKQLVEWKAALEGVLSPDMKRQLELQKILSSMEDSSVLNLEE